MEAGPGVAERAAEKRESEHTDQTKETGRKKKKEREKISTNREKRENVGMKERTSRMTEIGQMGGQNSRKI